MKAKLVGVSDINSGGGGVGGSYSSGGCGDTVECCSSCSCSYTSCSIPPASAGRGIVVTCVSGIEASVAGSIVATTHVNEINDDIEENEHASIAVSKGEILTDSVKRKKNFNSKNNDIKEIISSTHSVKGNLECTARVEECQSHTSDYFIKDDIVCDAKRDQTFTHGKGVQIQTSFDAKIISDMSLPNSHVHIDDTGKADIGVVKQPFVNPTCSFHVQPNPSSALSNPLSNPQQYRCGSHAYCLNSGYIRGSCLSLNEVNILPHVVSEASLVAPSSLLESVKTTNNSCVVLDTSVKKMLTDKQNTKNNFTFPKSTVNDNMHVGRAANGVQYAANHLGNRTSYTLAREDHNKQAEDGIGGGSTCSVVDNNQCNLETNKRAALLTSLYHQSLTDVVTPCNRKLNSSSGLKIFSGKNDSTGSGTLLRTKSCSADFQKSVLSQNINIKPNYHTERTHEFENVRSNTECKIGDKISNEVIELNKEPTCRTASISTRKDSKRFTRKKLLLASSVNKDTEINTILNSKTLPRDNISLVSNSQCNSESNDAHRNEDFCILSQKYSPSVTLAKQSSNRHAIHKDVLTKNIPTVVSNVTNNLIDDCAHYRPPSQKSSSHISFHEPPSTLSSQQYDTNSRKDITEKVKRDRFPGLMVSNGKKQKNDSKGKTMSIYSNHNFVAENKHKSMEKDKKKSSTSRLGKFLSRSLSTIFQKSSLSVQSSEVSQNVKLCNDIPIPDLKEKNTKKLSIFSRNSFRKSQSKLHCLVPALNEPQVSTITTTHQPNHIQQHLNISKNRIPSHVCYSTPPRAILSQSSLGEPENENIVPFNILIHESITTQTQTSASTLSPTQTMVTAQTLTLTRSETPLFINTTATTPSHTNTATTQTLTHSPVAKQDIIATVPSHSDIPVTMPLAIETIDKQAQFPFQLLVNSQSVVSESSQISSKMYSHDYLVPSSQYIHDTGSCNLSAHHNLLTESKSHCNLNSFPSDSCKFVVSNSVNNSICDTWDKSMVIPGNHPCCEEIKDSLNKNVFLQEGRILTYSSCPQSLNTVVSDNTSSITSPIVHHKSDTNLRLIDKANVLEEMSCGPSLNNNQIVETKCGELSVDINPSDINKILDFSKNSLNLDLIANKLPGIRKLITKELNELKVFQKNLPRDIAEKITLTLMKSLIEELIANSAAYMPEKQENLSVRDTVTDAIDQSDIDAKFNNNLNLEKNQVLVRKGNPMTENNHEQTTTKTDNSERKCKDEICNNIKYVKNLQNHDSLTSESSTRQTQEGNSRLSPLKMSDNEVVSQITDQVSNGPPNSYLYLNSINTSSDIINSTEIKEHTVDYYGSSSSLSSSSISDCSSAAALTPPDDSIYDLHNDPYYNSTYLEISSNWHSLDDIPSDHPIQYPVPIYLDTNRIENRLLSRSNEEFSDHRVIVNKIQEDNQLRRSVSFCGIESSALEKNDPKISCSRNGFATYTDGVIQDNYFNASTSSELYDSKSFLIESNSQSSSLSNSLVNNSNVSESPDEEFSIRTSANQWGSRLETEDIRQLYRTQSQPQDLCDISYDASTITSYKSQPLSGYSTSNGNGLNNKMVPARRSSLRRRNSLSRSFGSRLYTISEEENDIKQGTMSTKCYTLPSLTMEMKTSKAIEIDSVNEHNSYLLSSVNTSIQYMNRALEDEHDTVNVVLDHYPASQTAQSHVIECNSSDSLDSLDISNACEVVNEGEELTYYSKIYSNIKIPIMACAELDKVEFSCATIHDSIISNDDKVSDIALSSTFNDDYVTSNNRSDVSVKNSNCFVLDTESSNSPCNDISEKEFHLLAKGVKDVQQSNEVILNSPLIYCESVTDSQSGVLSEIKCELNTKEISSCKRLLSEKPVLLTKVSQSTVLKCDKESCVPVTIIPESKLLSDLSLPSIAFDAIDGKILSIFHKLEHDSVLTQTIQQDETVNMNCPEKSFSNNNSKDMDFSVNGGDMANFSYYDVHPNRNSSDEPDYILEHKQQDSGIIAENGSESSHLNNGTSVTTNNQNSALPDIIVSSHKTSIAKTNKLKMLSKSNPNLSKSNPNISQLDVDLFNDSGLTNDHLDHIFGKGDGYSAKETHIFEKETQNPTSSIRCNTEVGEPHDHQNGNFDSLFENGVDTVDNIGHTLWPKSSQVYNGNSINDDKPISQCSYDNLYIDEQEDDSNSLFNGCGGMYSAMSDLSALSFSTNNQNSSNLATSSSVLNSRSGSDFGAYASNSNLDTDTFSKTGRCYKWNLSSSISDLCSLSKQVDDTSPLTSLSLHKTSASASDLLSLTPEGNTLHSPGPSSLTRISRGGVVLPRPTCGGRTSYMAWSASLDDEDADEEFVLPCNFQNSSTTFGFTSNNSK